MFSLTPRVIRALRTMNLYLAFFGLGMMAAVIGPTLLDLQNAVSVSTDQIAYIYTGRSVGFLLGSIIGGILMDRMFNRQTFLSGCLLVASGSLVAAPLCKDLPTLIVAMAVGGMAMGAIDIGMNVWCLHLWGRESGPFFQALHFTFSLGSLVSPLIAEPFLSPSESENDNNGTSTTFPNYTLEMLSSSSPAVTEVGTFPPDEASSFSETLPTIVYAYGILSIYVFLVCVSFVTLYVIDPEDKRATNEKKDPSISLPGLAFTVVIIFFTALFLFVYMGTELAYGQMVATYSVKSRLKLSKSVGSFLTSLFWGACTFGRLTAVLFAIYLSPFQMVLGDLLVMLAGCLILFFSLDSVALLWAGTGVLGFGVASAFPSAMTWLERYIVLNNKVAGILTGAAACGEMVLPVSISFYIDWMPEVLMYIALSSSVACCGIFFVMWSIAKPQGQKYVKDKDESPRKSEPMECTKF